MKAFVKAAGVKTGEAFPGFGDHLHRNTSIGLFGHDVMMQNKLMLIFQNTDFDAQLNRYTSFTLADPFGMRLKNREHFLFVQNGFTLDDAAAVNTFALENGVGLLSMWSLNRDATCTSPLPKTVPVVQTSCSGIDQDGRSFADVLANGADVAVAEPSASGAAQSQVDPVVVDDPDTSPFPIWDPVGTYPAGTRVVWKREVYRAKYWTSGISPDTPQSTEESPWTLVGPVLPGDKPAPLPTLPANTYPTWKAKSVYNKGQRVQVGRVPYEAKWWTQGQPPGEPVAGGSPWVLVSPG